jgi:hypothetical protein
MKKSEKDFIQGYACAMAQLIRLHGEPSMARDLINCGGFTLDDFKKAECDEYDLKPIEELLK